MCAAAAAAMVVLAAAVIAWWRIPSAVPVVESVPQLTDARRWPVSFTATPLFLVSPITTALQQPRWLIAHDSAALRSQIFSEPISRKVGPRARRSASFSSSNPANRLHATRRNGPSKTKTEGNVTLREGDEP